MKRHADFSPCGQYRYALTRVWEQTDRGHVVFVGLNPSTADDARDDPTIRRCIAFAKSWGYGGLTVLNLFAFRATASKDLLVADEPVGPDNNAWLQTALHAPLVIAAWGRLGSHRQRASQVRAMLPAWHYLRLNKDGAPAHPLYLPGTLTPQKWLADPAHHLDQPGPWQ